MLGKFSLAAIIGHRATEYEKTAQHFTRQITFGLSNNL